MRLHLASIAASLCFAASCAESAAPVEELRIAFSVAPGEVQAGDTLRARLAIHNQTNKAKELMSGCGTPTMLSVLRDGESVPMQGGFGCRTVVTRLEIAARDSFVENYSVVALLNEGQSPWRYIVPPPPGGYRLHLSMQVPLPDQYAEFRVRE